jgi:hypothetical protein
MVRHFEAVEWDSVQRTHVTANPRPSVTSIYECIISCQCIAKLNWFDERTELKPLSVTSYSSGSEVAWLSSIQSSIWKEKGV